MAAKEQYRYAIEELVADESSAENKRLEREAGETEFNKQKVSELSNISVLCNVSIFTCKKKNYLLKKIF